MKPSCILWQNKSKTVVLLDLPRSIEEAQVLSSACASASASGSGFKLLFPTERRKLRRLISAPPPTCPFPTPEPKKAGCSNGLYTTQSASSHAAQVAELMTQAAVESALYEIKTSYDGPWCLPRVTAAAAIAAPHQHQSQPKLQPPTGPSPRASSPPCPAPTPTPLSALAPETTEKGSRPPRAPGAGPQLSGEVEQPDMASSFSGEPLSPYLIPPKSHFLPGTISSLRATFLSKAPQFNLILLDPPWPNRSAKRKRKRGSRGDPSAAYNTATDLTSIRSLLNQIPVAAHLAPGGYVAVWVTNSARFTDLLLTASGGNSSVFDEWGVELVGEWTWLKITARGEPIVGLESVWRRPWERLLIARKKGFYGHAMKGPVKDKVILAVPDAHSRKPNLRALFEEELLPERYEALEVFARSMTAGWWAWGDEVLLFQRRECWVDQADEPIDPSIEPDEL